MRQFRLKLLLLIIVAVWPKALAVNRDLQMGDISGKSSNASMTVSYVGKKSESVYLMK